MPLDPQIQALLNRRATRKIPAVATLEPQHARELIKSIIPQHPPATDITIKNLTIKSHHTTIPLRIYTPNLLAPINPQPALIYIHGGGFVLCDLDTHDHICQKLAQELHWTVIAIDYRRAPEYPFPAAPEDCYAATQWIYENAHQLNIDPHSMVIGGDSAGANLATVVCMMARDRGTLPQLQAQLLIYPTLDTNFDTSSCHKYANGYLITRDDLIWCWNHYLQNNSDAHHPYATPLRATNYAHLPPAIIITAEYDPLHDDGATYAQRLQEAQVKVTYRCFAGLIHDFFSMFKIVTRASQAFTAITEMVRRTC